MNKVALILLIAITICSGCMHLKVVDCNSEIDYVIIRKLYQKGVIGNAWCLNDSLLFTHVVGLINNPSNYNGWNHQKPLYDLNDLPHRYSIVDIEPPFTLSKKANTDTLLVQKDTFSLVFLMQCI
tara:strand:+ start:86 stop:460 length:375 start_codon:yes stop_codon:yes gene_type:complete